MRQKQGQWKGWISTPSASSQAFRGVHTLSWKIYSVKKILQHINAMNIKAIERRMVRKGIYLWNDRPKRMQGTHRCFQRLPARLFMEIEILFYKPIFLNLKKKRKKKEMFLSKNVWYYSENNASLILSSCLSQVAFN